MPRSGAFSKHYKNMTKSRTLRIVDYSGALVYTHSLSKQKQPTMKTFLIWSILISALLWTAMALEQAITPFFISAIIAYITHPFVQKISTKFSINRLFVILFIVFLVIFFVIGCGMVFIPLVSKQISLLVSKIPAYKDYIQHNILPIITQKLEHLSPDMTQKFDNIINTSLNNISQSISNIVNHIFDYTTGLASVLFTILLIPIVLFYFLKDWPQNGFVLTVFNETTQTRIKKLFSQIDTLLSAYMRGQFKVCFIMMIYYSITLYLIGFDFALLMGVISGIIIILPYLGFLFAFSISLMLAYFNFGISIELAYIVASYLIGSILEGSILAPKIIGGKIGMHPLWIIFSVLACGELFGLIGMLFAIPIAGIVKILIEFLLEIYKHQNSKSASI